MAATLNEYVTIDNPLDYHTFIWNQEDKLTATFSAVLRGGYDVAMLILDAPTHPKMKPDTWMVTAQALMNAAGRHRGARRHGRQPCRRHAARSRRRALGSHGVAPMIGLDDALTAFEAAAFIGRNWARRDAPAAHAEARTLQASARQSSERV